MAEAVVALRAAIEAIGLDWIRAKIFVEHTIGFSHDALHVIAGVGLQLVLAGVLRVSARSIWPWSIVLLLELANESSDIYFDVWPDHAKQWGEGAKDVLLTMALPTFILAVARFRPQILVRPGEHR